MHFQNFGGGGFCSSPPPWLRLEIQIEGDILHHSPPDLTDEGGGRQEPDLEVVAVVEEAQKFRGGISSSTKVACSFSRSGGADLLRWWRRQIWCAARRAEVAATRLAEVAAAGRIRHGSIRGEEPDCRAEAKELGRRRLAPGASILPLVSTEREFLGGKELGI